MSILKSFLLWSALTTYAFSHAAQATVYLPNFLTQLECVKRLGGCANVRDGLPSEAEIVTYDRECRTESHFEGEAVTLGQVGLLCNSVNVNQDNLRTIVTLWEETGRADAKLLALMFTDTRIVDGGTQNGRLDAILNALETPGTPGARFAFDGFSDVGLRGDPLRNGSGFRDPWPGSRNQVGHFLTAVGLGFNPGLVQRTAMTQSLRSLLSAPISMSDEEVAMRLIVGHEKAEDAPPNADPFTQFFKAREQFSRANANDLEALLGAEVAAGRNVRLDMNAVEPFLRRVDINLDWDGNSIQDLRLSFVGWHLGRLVREGYFASSADIAHWLRINLM